MLKKFLLLILFGFAEHKCVALCCFSKKAVPAADPDADELRRLDFWVQEERRLNSSLVRALTGTHDLRDVHYQIQANVTMLKSNAKYQQFIEDYNCDVLYKSDTAFYADDKEAQERELAVVLPAFPKLLIGQVTDYLWQHGVKMEVKFFPGTIMPVESVIIVDKCNQKHVLTSCWTRTVFNSAEIKSLRFLTLDNLWAIGMMKNIKKKSRNPEVRTRQDANLERYIQKHRITGRAVEIVRRREHLLIPASD